MSGFTTRSPSPNQNRSTSANRSISSGRKSVDLSHYTNKSSSPSDFSHKSFNSKHHSQKENERDPPIISKPKGRSPLLTSPSSSSHKGFMAPTISASSKTQNPKTLNPSPKPRSILSERNQNPSIEPPQNPTEPPQNLSSSKSSQVEPSVSLPPYDPKTNFLSPRPQYLHYRPIPRLELYKKGELDLFDARNLEQSFSSESSGSSSVKLETEARSSEIELIETEETETEANSSETELIETEETETEAVFVRIESKTKRVKLKIVPLVLVMLLVGCVFLPLSDSPVQNPSSELRNPNSLQLGEFDAKLMEISTRLTHWSTQSIQYLSNLFATEPSFRIEIGFLPLANLSSIALDEAGNLGSNLVCPISNGESFLSQMMAKNTTVGFESVENEDVKEIQDRFEIATNIEEEDEEEETVTGNGSELDTEKNQQEIAKELDNGSGSEPVKEENSPESTVENFSELDNGFGSEQVKEEISKESVNELDNGCEPVRTEKLEISSTEIVINENSNGFGSEPVKEQSSVETINENVIEMDIGFGSEPVKEATESSNLISNSNPAIGIIATVTITSLASLVFLTASYLKKKNRVSVSVPTNEKKTTNPKMKESEKSSFDGRSQMENSSVDVGTEFSTSFEGTKYSTGTDWKRRESDVSSGSFGSFTTCEKISYKKVNGEEMTTPVTVRRSSRIRSRLNSS